MIKINKKDIILFIIGLIILIPTLYMVKNHYEEKDNIDIDEIVTEDDNMNTNIKMIIDNKEYKVLIEENELGKKFLDLLPLEIEMTDLNNNEKYYNLNSKLPSNPISINTIKKGDLMLFGNDCIVLFYDSFDTEYKYTRIGKVIDDFNVGSGTITVKFDK